MTVCASTITSGHRGELTLTTRVLNGPPRPVVVITVVGEIDRSNEHLLRVAVGEGGCDADRCRSTDRRCTRGALVVDLRAATFVSSSVYACLVDESRSGRRVGLVAEPAGRVRRALRTLDITELAVHLDVPSAVLAEVGDPE